MAINPKQLNQTQADIDDIKRRQKLFELITMGVIVVLFLGFLGLIFSLGTLMVDTYRGSESSYSELVNKLDQQSNKIDALMNAKKK